MRRVATAWKVIESVLKENAHSAYKALRGPASAPDIRALEELIGTRLPQTLVSSLRIHDGMQPGVNLVNYNSLLPVAEIGRWWRITMGNRWDGPGPGLIDRKRIKGDFRWREGWVPIAVDAGGNLLACDLDHGPTGTRSQVFPWQNYGSPPPKVIVVVCGVAGRGRGGVAPSALHIRRVGRNPLQQEAGLTAARWKSAEPAASAELRGISALRGMLSFR
jgi:cell wall assembly regulator SMI1